MNSDGDTLAGGLPHSEIPGSTIARISPGLFAACHVLHRLSVPRHPPDALLYANPRPARQQPQSPPNRPPQCRRAQRPAPAPSARWPPRPARAARMKTLRSDPPAVPRQRMPGRLPGGSTSVTRSQLPLHPVKQHPGPAPRPRVNPFNTHRQANRRTENRLLRTPAPPELRQGRPSPLAVLPAVMCRWWR
jgi:hypothetical protein